MAAKKKTTKKTSTKPRQTRIPGIEEPHPDVSAAACAYRDARDARMELTKSEVTTRAALIAAMNQHDLKVYEDTDENLRVEIEVPGVKVKVKKLESEE